MTHARGLFGLVLATLISGQAHAALPQPSAAELKAFRYGSLEADQHPTNPPALLVAWDHDLRRLPGPKTGLGDVAALAAKYGLAPKDLRELAEIWTSTQGADEAWTLADAGSPPRVELRARLLALLEATHDAPLVAATAGAALAVGEACPLEDFRAVTAVLKADTRTAWDLARAADCAGALRAFVEADPEAASVALPKLEYYGWLGGADQLALLAEMTQSAFLERIDPEDRAYVTALLNKDFIEGLADAGLAERAIRVFEALPPATRALVVSGPFPKRSIRVDGLQTTIAQEFNDRTLGARVALMSAYLLVGRAGDAQAIGLPPDLVGRIRDHIACMVGRGAATGKRAPCKEAPSGGYEIAMLDQLLNHPADDPYPIAETFCATGTGQGCPGDGRTVVDLVCRVFADGAAKALCEDGRAQWARADDDTPYAPDPDKLAARAAAAARSPGFTRLRAEFAAALAAARPAPTSAHGEGPGHTAADGPATSPFVEAPIPPEFRGAATPGDVRSVKGFAPLPAGFEPVRVARDSARVAVISVSQNYDPTGEVSRGGYWVHLSDDGGRHWGAPLYTGLAELYPYVVVPDARLPLFDGDALDLAVDVREIDPTSITYPPVALRTRRQAENLFLKIPLAQLKADSRGDGLTDIARRHLLLDAPPGPSETPLRLDEQTPGECAIGPGERTQAIAAFLEQLFSGGTGAIIEPVDRPSGDATAAVISELAAASHAAPVGADRPIFIEGTAADFRCLRSKRLIIVYDQSDVARLRRFTPDFHATELGPFIADRSGERGYVAWSSGWTGGTLLARRVGGRWTVETLSSWIS